MMAQARVKRRRERVTIKVAHDIHEAMTRTRLRMQTTGMQVLKWDDYLKTADYSLNLELDRIEAAQAHEDPTR